MPSADKSRILALVALTVAVAALVGVYAWRTAAPPVSSASLPPLSMATTPEPAPEPAAAQQEAAPVAPAEPAAGTPEATAPAAEAPATPAPATPRAAFLVRHTGLDQSYGTLAADTGTGAPNSRQATGLRCERVYFAGSHGICLDARRGALTTYSAILFDAQFKPTATLSLAGIPSRARISPDGRYASVTVFVSGHSYSGSDFSTHTQIVDGVTGAPVIPDLEKMEVWNGESRMSAADFNFWGVTFARDSNRFYATLGTGGIAYLVQGDIAANRVTILKPGVECPSLSPDNTRVAYKKRVPGSGLAKWRLYILDLATLTETAVNEPRFIDEQVEWLDDARILYTQVAENAPSPAVTDVWVAAADGSGTPSLLLKNATSPTVLHR